MREFEEFEGDFVPEATEAKGTGTEGITRGGSEVL